MAFRYPEKDAECTSDEASNKFTEQGAVASGLDSAQVWRYPLDPAHFETALVAT